MADKDKKKNGKAESGEKKTRKHRDKDYTVNIDTRHENTSLGTVDIDVQEVTFTSDGDKREFVASKSGREAMFKWLSEKRRKATGRATKDDRLKSAVGLAYKNLLERIEAYTVGEGTLEPDEARLLEGIQEAEKEMAITFPVLERKPRTKKEKK
jgi:hypothetical protein